MTSFHGAERPQQIKRTRRLTKRYPGSDKGVTDLSLHVCPGYLTAFIGHNGVGKTTTLKCVAGNPGL